MHSMKQIVNSKVIRKWSEGMGLQIAIILIKQKLRCSRSKAQKLAAGRYLSGLSELEQEVLVKVTKIKMEDLFQQTKVRKV